jgi:protein tyrosine phosphatase
MQDKEEYLNANYVDGFRWPRAFIATANSTALFIIAIWCLNIELKLQDKEEYLNANYVDGFRRPRAFIATQGPMANSTALFFTDIWCLNIELMFHAGQRGLSERQLCGRIPTAMSFYCHTGPDGQQHIPFLQ